VSVALVVSLCLVVGIAAIGVAALVALVRLMRLSPRLEGR
jgi:Ni/Fe-hydrogenase subunit HybB-like protein